MAERVITGGFTWELAMHDGVVFPRWIHKHMKNMKKRQTRNDDIYLCSYLKSGAHCLLAILNMIVAGKAEYHKHLQNYSWLEYRTEEELEELESPRILHTHLLPRMLPESVWQKKCKLVYVQRNPKDVIVSCYNQTSRQIWKNSNIPCFQGTFEDMVAVFLEGAMPFGSWFDHVTEWNDVTDVHPNVEVCYIKYEDMKENCAGEIKKISEYLERPLSDKICCEIAEACRLLENDQTYRRRRQNSDSEGYFQKGIVGDWKNWFTTAQSETIDMVCEEKLKQTFPS